jgi:hypothetical protein
MPDILALIRQEKCQQWLYNMRRAAVPIEWDCLLGIKKALYLQHQKWVQKVGPQQSMVYIFKKVLQINQERE